MGNPGASISLDNRLHLSDDVDIWVVNMEDHDSDDYKAFLSKTEVENAFRLKNAALARKMIISRGVLRLILGKYLSINPTEIDISIESKGKPVLSKLHNKSINFNVSHSKSLLSIAVSEKKVVGIDIEWMNQDIDTRKMALMMFCEEEMNYLEENSYSHMIFYQIWTLKEAVLKTSGTGFSYPSTRFSVISSKNKNYLSRLTGEVTQGLNYNLHQFGISNGYIGALSTTGL